MGRKASHKWRILPLFLSVFLFFFHFLHLIPLFPLYAWIYGDETGTVAFSPLGCVKFMLSPSSVGGEKAPPPLHSSGAQETYKEDRKLSTSCKRTQNFAKLLRVRPQTPNIRQYFFIFFARGAQSSTCKVWIMDMHGARSRLHGMKEDFWNYYCK